MDLRGHIEHIVRRTVPSLPDGAVQEIATHMLSHEVGLTSVGDLKDMCAEFLPKNVPIPLLKQKQLLAAFVKMATEQGPNEGGQAGEAAVPDPPYRGLPIPQDNEYKFTITWSQLDRTLVDALELAKTNQKKASPKQISELRVGIMKKLVQNYIQYRATNPSVTKKHPGRKIYTSVTEQVSKRFKGAIFTVINGEATRDSKKAFMSKFEVCVENKMKKYNRGPRKAVKGTATIGVLLQEYNPIVVDREVQEGIQEHLANLYDVNPDPATYDWELVREDMDKAYPLQREDILESTEAVEKQRDKENVNPLDNEFEDEPPIDKACEALKKKWPYLFKPEGLTQHHFRLTRRNLFGACQAFKDEHLKYLQMFLTSCTTHNVENLIHLRKAERAQFVLTEELNFLVMVQMLCEVFQYDIETLIFTTEKTTQPNVFEWTVLDKVQHPCIVALDKNMYKAERYFVCTDKVPLYECKSAENAIICLFMMCFVLDLEYPMLPKLFEFVERFVFSMGLIDTKVKTKQGKQITFTSEKVRKFSEDYESFRERYLTAMAIGQ